MDFIAVWRSGFLVYDQLPPFLSWFFKRPRDTNYQCLEMRLMRVRAQWYLNHKSAPQQCLSFLGYQGDSQPKAFEVRWKNTFV